MFERKIAVKAVLETLAGSDILEDYADGRYLTLGWIGGKALHVVAEDDILARTSTIVTVYEPDPGLWRPGFRERKI
jgi:hypothetical protein